MSAAAILHQFQRLWDGSEAGWCVVRNSENDSMMPFNKSGYVMLIEDHEMCTTVCLRMIEAGLEVLDDLPELRAAEVTVERQ